MPDLLRWQCLDDGQGAYFDAQPASGRHRRSQGSRCELSAVLGSMLKDLVFELTLSPAFHFGASYRPTASLP